MPRAHTEAGHLKASMDPRSSVILLFCWCRNCPGKLRPSRSCTISRENERWVLLSSRPTLSPCRQPPPPSLWRASGHLFLGALWWPPWWCKLNSFLGSRHGNKMLPGLFYLDVHTRSRKRWSECLHMHSASLRTELPQQGKVVPENNCILWRCLLCLKQIWKPPWETWLHFQIQRVT